MVKLLLGAIDPSYDELDEYGEVENEKPEKSILKSILSTIFKYF